MVLLQPKLHLKVSQRQILTPGLVQMVSVLALNKLELRDMITAEMVENPVLEELEDSVPLIDELGRRQEDRDRPTPEENTVTAVEKKDPFEEIDFGSFFQEYLDPGYRSPGEMEEIERPSFENFLSKPGNLTDHLTWQLGAIPTRPAVREAAELIIGNLSEDGYLIASDDELMGVAPPAPPEVDATIAQNVVKEAAALGLATAIEEPDSDAHIPSEWNENEALDLGPQDLEPPDSRNQTLNKQEFENAGSTAATGIAPALDTTPKVSVAQVPEANPVPKPVYRPNFSLSDLHEALELVRQMDPPGVACRGLRECLLCQLHYHQHQLAVSKNGNGEATAQVLSDAIPIVDQHLRALQNKQYKEIAKAIARPIEAVQQALQQGSTSTDRA
jgi:RNA polymerase sigma-54 factor